MHTRRLVTGLLVLTACSGPYDVRLLGPSGFRDDQTLTFGDVELGQVGLKEFAFFNGANGVAELVAVRRVEGDAVSAPPLLDEAGAVFRVDDFGAAALEPLEQRVKSVHYDPPAAATELEHHARVEFDFRTARGTTTLALTLRGHALHFTCGQPPTLDFLAVYRGESSSMDYVFTNPRDVPDDITITPSSDVDFKLDEVGSFTLAPHSEHVLRVTFDPGVIGSFSAESSVRRSVACPTMTLRLLANSTDRVLVTSSLDATLRAGTQGEVLALVKNASRAAVPVTASVVGDGFALADSNLVVPPASRGREGELLPGVLTPRLTFTATVAGTFRGELRVATGLARQPLLVVPLTVIVF